MVTLTVVALVLVLTPIYAFAQNGFKLTSQDREYPVASQQVVDESFVEITGLYRNNSVDGTNEAATQENATEVAKKYATLEDPVLEAVPQSVTDNAQTAAEAKSETSAAQAVEGAAKTDAASLAETAGNAWLNDAQNADAIASSLKGALEAQGRSNVTITSVNSASASVSKDDVSVEGCAVTSGSLTVTPSVDKSSILFNKEAGFKATGATAADANVLELGELTEDAFTVKVKDGYAGTDAGKILYSYEYTPSITSYTYGYSASYSYSYENWNTSTWSYQANVTYQHDVEGVPTTVTENVTVNTTVQLSDNGRSAESSVSETNCQAEGLSLATGLAASTGATTAEGGTQEIAVVNLFSTTGISFPSQAGDKAQTYYAFVNEPAKGQSADLVANAKAGEIATANWKLIDTDSSEDTKVEEKDGKYLYKVKGRWNRWNTVFTVEYNSSNQTITITPKGASTDQYDACVAWYTDSSKTTMRYSRNLSVAVNPIEVSEITLSDQAFAAEDDLCSYILNEANAKMLEAAKKATPKADTWPQNANYYESVAITGYDPTGLTEQTYSITFTKNENADENWGLFLITDPTTVTVKAVAGYEWANFDDASFGLVATAKKNNQDNQTFGKQSDLLPATNSWVQSTPVMTVKSDASGKKVGNTTYKVEKLLTASETGYEEAASITLAGTQGEYLNDFVYASVLKTEGQVSEREICKIAIDYQIDSTVPVLKYAAFSRVGGSGQQQALSQEQIIKINEEKAVYVADKLKVSLSVSDAATDPATQQAIKTSGLPQSLDVTYAPDGGSEKKVTANLEDGYYVFTISEKDARITLDSIKVSLTDNAANKDTKNLTQTELSNTPDETILDLIQNGTAPTITAAWQDTPDSGTADNNFFMRVLTVTVEYPNFRFFDESYGYGGYYDQTIMTFTDNGMEYTITPADFTETETDSGVWTFQHTFAVDADDAVSAVSIKDLLGNIYTAQDFSAAQSFTIDTIAPTLNVTWDNDDVRSGKYYDAWRIATLTVDERNFATAEDVDRFIAVSDTDVNAGVQSAWTKGEGNTWIKTVAYEADGNYRLQVSGTDKALNVLSSYDSGAFVVDTTKPEISFSGITNQTAYAGTAQPGVVVSDTNVSEASTVEVSKVSYPLSSDDANPYTETRVIEATKITVDYPNPDSLAANDGIYTIQVNAVDLAGNTATDTITWSVNRFGSTYMITGSTQELLNNYVQSSKLEDVVVTEINPSGINENEVAVEVTKGTDNSTLEKDSDYTLEASTQGWKAYTYTVARENFVEGGAFQMLLHSTDIAGNVSENTMDNKNATRTNTAEVKFAVDDIKPLLSFANLEAKGYNEAAHVAQVSIEDNLKLDHAVITADDKEIVTFDAQQLAEANVHEFQIGEADHAQTIKVVAYDAAGNTEELVLGGVVVSANLFVLWANSPLAIIVTIIVVALIAFLIVRKVRKGRKSAGDIS